jgi:hypothetical protein
VERHAPHRTNIMTNRCVCSFARSLGKLHARRSRASWQSSGRIDLR